MPILSERLRPHRSLSRKQFHVLLGAVGAGGVVASLPFVMMGAWPVAGFMGLDVLAVYIAFKASFRQARAYEDVTLTVLELSVAKVSPKGLRAEWRFNPSWVRLQRDEHEDYGTMRIDVVSRGQRLEVASFLGPDQKAKFADRLSRGLAQARAGMRLS
ncbi:MULTISPECIES: DUF2244 domain-containing protein [Lichenihabitans]|uniref:DUF2244 domain-containing protein n=1 Tax=Lichenihabitans TaxID=2723776 RepID=UPI001036F0D0|nr:MULTISPECIES: DUF2244 domain-containing protein [Lichenihabitans]UDL96684.1 DUF2244 domain-containing protein [Lichenihabitans sp. PAMC28606]